MCFGGDSSPPPPAPAPTPAPRIPEGPIRGDDTRQRFSDTRGPQGTLAGGGAFDSSTTPLRGATVLGRSDK